jgi:hypothetical protein
MICRVCYGVLRGHQGSQWRGTFDLHFDHHSNRRELEDSAEMSCVICRSLFEALKRLEAKEEKKAAAVWDGLSSYLRLLFWGESDTKETETKSQKRFLSAYLSEVHGLRKSAIYRLDFKFRDSERIGSFALQQIGKPSNIRPVPDVS